MAATGMKELLQVLLCQEVREGKGGRSSAHQKKYPGRWREEVGLHVDPITVKQDVGTGQWPVTEHLSQGDGPFPEDVKTGERVIGPSPEGLVIGQGRRRRIRPGWYLYLGGIEYHLSNSIPATNILLV